MCWASNMSSKVKESFSSLLPPVVGEPGAEFDLLNRTSWADAYIAYRQIKKERADGNQASLWVRSQLQAHLCDIGNAIQRNAGKILFVGILVLATFCIGLKSVHVEHDLEKLWVEEGGRVTRELEYIRTKLDMSPASFADQVVIQTPGTGANRNILHPDSLLLHAHVLRKALQVEVELYDYTWSLEDMCVKPSVPSLGEYYKDEIFAKFMPCIIQTPLDCFWEGSTLLNLRGPVPIYIEGNDTVYAKWSNLNPTEMLNAMKAKFDENDDFELIEKYMIRAGVTTGYQDRPCLNPKDPECPTPNRPLANVGEVLTGGCKGFSTNFMHWSEDLILGGIKKNRSGLIVKAEAIQSVVQILEDKEMFEMHADTYNHHNTDWSIEKAREVIDTWQKKFGEEIKKHSREMRDGPPQRFNVFTFNALRNIVRSFSRPSVARIFFGVVLILVYVSVVLMNLQKPELSQSLVGFVGVLLVSLSITSGYGFCAMIGITFNITSTQVLPFLALGLGTNGIFLLSHTLNKIISCGSIPLEEQTGECLKRTGVNIVLSNTALIFAFFAASLIPIPALRSFSLQAAILLIFSMVTTLLLFPAVFSLDLQRRASRRLDIFCCLKQEPEPRSTCEPAAKLVTGQPQRLTDEAFVRPTIAIISVDENNENELRLRRQRGLDDGCYGVSLSQFAADWYAPFIHHPAVKTFVVFSSIGLLAFGIMGVTRMEEGMHLSDFIPKASHEYEYLVHQQRYFSFYNIFAVTQANFEYPANQRLLHEYHDAFARVENIVKNEDGGLPDFWLSLFRDWLLGLQKTFDDEYRMGWINSEGWNANASNDGILAYKLLVQTGRADNPVNKSQVATVRLVDKDGIIDNKAFYNYLTAWYNNDPLGYESSQAQLVPQPQRWDEIPRSNELKIKKSAAIQYAQLPFYLHNLNSTKDIVTTIAQLRAISEKFEDRGLPNFPTGLPLVYWEQYLNLRFYLAVAILLILGTVFVTISSVLLNLGVAFIITIVLASCVLQILGVLHVLQITLSAVPAVLIIMSVGMGVDFTLHLTMGFLTALGKKSRRVSMSLEYMCAPMVHSSFTTLLGIAMLAFSEFDFVIRHFSYLMSAMIGIYAYNGFVVLPVFLTLVGPAGDLVPRKNLNHIDPPTPRSSPVLEPRSKSSGRGHSSKSNSGDFSKYKHKKNFPTTRSEMSLSTITEEPSSYQGSSPEPESTKIVVEPEITVETTTTTNTANGQVTSSATAAPSPMPSTDSGTNSPTVVTTTDVTPLGTNVTTKVTTTAKVKVEVHAPMPPFIHSDYWNGGRPPSRRSSRYSDYRPNPIVTDYRYR